MPFFFPANHLNAFHRKWKKGVGANRDVSHKKEERFWNLWAIAKPCQFWNTVLECFLSFCLFVYFSYHLLSKSVTQHLFPNATIIKAWCHIKTVSSWFISVHRGSRIWFMSWAKDPAHLLLGSAGKEQTRLSRLRAGAGACLYLETFCPHFTLVSETLMLGYEPTLPIFPVLARPLSRPIPAAPCSHCLHVTPLNISRELTSQARQRPGFSADLSFLPHCRSQSKCICQVLSWFSCSSIAWGMKPNLRIFPSWACGGSLLSSLLVVWLQQPSLSAWEKASPPVFISLLSAAEKLPSSLWPGPQEYKGPAIFSVLWAIVNKTQSVPRGKKHHAFHLPLC